MTLLLPLIWLTLNEPAVAFGNFSAGGTGLFGGGLRGPNLPLLVASKEDDLPESAGRFRCAPDMTR